MSINAAAILLKDVQGEKRLGRIEALFKSSTKNVLRGTRGGGDVLL